MIGAASYEWKIASKTGGIIKAYVYCFLTTPARAAIEYLNLHSTFHRVDDTRAGFRKGSVQASHFKHTASTKSYGVLLLA
jgi:hypothetical protein